MKYNKRKFDYNFLQFFTIDIIIKNDIIIILHFSIDDPTNDKKKINSFYTWSSKEHNKYY